MSRAITQRTPLFLACSAVLFDHKTRETRKGKKWDKAELLLKAAYSHLAYTSPSLPKEYNFLTAVVTLDQYLPEQIAKLALASDGNILKVADSVMGRLPLLQAAVTKLYSRQCSDDLLAMFLQAYPEAAHTRDKDGKSALQLAVESGKPWSAGVGRLFDANPEAIQWVDHMGLSPVLSAAMVVTTTDTIDNLGQQDTLDENPLGLLSSKDKEALRQRRLEMLKPSAGEQPITEHEHLSSLFQLISADPSTISSSDTIPTKNGRELVEI